MSIKRAFHLPFQVIYSEARLLPSIRRSLTALIFGNLFGTLFTSITTGSALTGYAAALGANDFSYGLLTGIPLTAALIQIPAAILVSRTRRRKRYMLTFGTFSRVLWLLVGLVPFLLPEDPAALRLWSVIFLVGISAAAGSFINVCFVPWLADLVPIGIRGRWISFRDSIISITSVVVGVLTALLLDRMGGFAGYAVVLCLGGALGVADMLCFVWVEDVKSTSPPARASLRAVLAQIWKDKPFFRFMVFWTVWNFAANIGNPYLTRYALSEIGLTFMQLTLWGQIAALVSTALFISTWGRMIDRCGTKPVLLVTGIVTALSPVFYLFAVRGSVLPTLLHNFIGAAFWSGTNICATHVQLTRSPDSQRPIYIAVFGCISSLLGAFPGVLFGGALLEAIGGLGLGPDPRYKIVFAISILARLGVAVFLTRRLVNEKDCGTAGMIRELTRHLTRSRI